MIKRLRIGSVDIKMKLEKAVVETRHFKKCFMIKQKWSMDELNISQSHCGDNCEGTFFCFHDIYIYIYIRVMLSTLDIADIPHIPTCNVVM